MQKLFMDCLFSAYFKGKGTFTVFCISHYRMYWHTPYWVSGVCVWAWAFGVGGGVPLLRYTGTLKSASCKILVFSNHPQPGRGKHPPRAARQHTGAGRMNPHPLLPWGQLCARPEAELSSKQYSARFCWPAEKPAWNCHCQSEITGFLWTHPFQPHERSGLVLSGDQTGRCDCWF